ncbi:MAG: HEPN domain-containing protein [Holophagales bacterium]|nr:HEPN domain-containing protein [Holophagales bacterium]
MNVQRRRIDAFLRLADEELQAARQLARTSPRQAAYLTQQCAEKIARAVLTAAGVKYGTGNNLAQMAEALPAGHPWVEKILPLNKLSPAATRYRYPSAEGRLFEPPDITSLQQDLEELASLLEEATGFLARAEE